MTIHRPNHRTVPVKIHFTETTYALMCQELNLVYSTTKPPYGSKSALVDQLVKDWLNLRREERAANTTALNQAYTALESPNV